MGEFVNDKQLDKLNEKITEKIANVSACWVMALADIRYSDTNSREDARRNLEHADAMINRAMRKCFKIEDLLFNISRQIDEEMKKIDSEEYFSKMAEWSNDTEVEE